MRETSTSPALPFTADKYGDADSVLAGLIDTAALSPSDRAAISARAATLVSGIRSSAKPGLMEVFLAEYGLSTGEGVALMCLAEALLRVPDSATIDDLIEDKIAPSDWGTHLGRSSSSLVNASTWALMLTGKVLEGEKPGLVGTLRGAVKRLGEPVIRTAVARAMREMGRQFVLGEDMKAAMARAANMEKRGYTYSYDMLGEAARTAADAARYTTAYARAIDAMAPAAIHGDIRANPGISVKFSALHPRYEVAQTDRVLEELVPRVTTLARQAARLGIGFNVDAEEADRLTLSLQVIEQVLADRELAGWDGFGVVVQAYGLRCAPTIDWLHALATRLDRKIMVRLVKGAYWDTEIKHAQTLGMPSFPVFTAKPATDVSYIANARKLLAMTDRIYPQLATHNAHTVAAILHMADDKSSFEFQRLHGMGERLHDIVLEQENTHCRIYAPVGAHRDLLAYLVRRLLENGANSSFVNQIVDEDVTPEQVAADPFDQIHRKAPVRRGTELFAPERDNSKGFDLSSAATLAKIAAARDISASFDAAPILAGPVAPGEPKPVHSPTDGTQIGKVQNASPEDVETALSAAAPWDVAQSERAAILNRAADLYEQNFGAFFTLLAREAGKTLTDCVGELREAVDFLRYYAAQSAHLTHPACGVFTCISPWNFPLAIFTGQIAGALASGNGVLAKPAPQTPLVAHLAVTLLHAAGVPRASLQLLPGDGTVGAALTSDARIAGVAFTGSTATALKIRAGMAAHMAPGAPLIAETGGLNAMIIDSTALLEQAVRDVVMSAFQSAGQRCSALRCLYVQEDIASDFKRMLFGAMDELSLGDPWDLATDTGPLIDATARAQIADHIGQARAEGRLDKQLSAPKQGHFIAPTVIEIPGIAALKREIFGPVLHIATFRAGEIDRVIADINATGYGLTFGLHTRIDTRVQEVTDAIAAGNIYVNRNQIGAVVGSQPFGGEGLSGTGPKAGGPSYLPRFTAELPKDRGQAGEDSLPQSDTSTLSRTLSLPLKPMKQNPKDLPGPTGESNRLSIHPRLPLLCLGPSDNLRAAQKQAVEALGGTAILARLDTETLETLPIFGGTVWWGDSDTSRAIGLALSRRDGPIVPLITGTVTQNDVTYERHICIDTTASGGNAALLAEAATA
ncbi:bifunctional proline dehydrogenase/L-glutamate gamma-semialdehyde dehydrogenase PutA [Oceaniovalibus sp. ACAM 378]|uniref:bifunctional proline dehydrogenase/L-glutamate gamma-semialdehyde dehydrogenase PutA n=1 Tax=Oceaniovalibus sp. ACAM 378 TaxID=2599923 RepID=UPI0011D65EB8|nr:bifunctional proline dehydrogenase/L-glutamate gamma-semialdehyde dehydrogenase PutA [Oceaniovalibus sp. ACAM 378]TYB90060.1 bifunctional proline dehydrogenase/L-glutamate gamma-semialdehyde dehydrogenase PutA [Oceaniovalibus sp. ACAM 378]